MIKSPYNQNQVNIQPKSLAATILVSNLYWKLKFPLCRCIICFVTTITFKYKHVGTGTLNYFKRKRVLQFIILKLKRLMFYHAIQISFCTCIVMKAKDFTKSAKFNLLTPKIQKYQNFLQWNYQSNTIRHVKDIKNYSTKT